MKKQLIILCSLMMFLGLSLPQSYAVGTATTPVTTVNENGEAEKTALRTSKKKGKIAQFFQKKKAQAKGLGLMVKASWKMMKAGKIDLKDDVEKWKWFWILGWAAAVVLYILAIIFGIGSVVSGTGSGFGLANLFSWLGYACGIFGTISLIMYLVKGDII